MAMTQPLALSSGHYINSITYILSYLLTYTMDTNDGRNKLLVFGIMDGKN